MKNLLLTRLLLISLCLVASLSAVAQQIHIAGEAVDSLTGKPVPFAAVLLVGTTRGELTDEDGRFSFDSRLTADSVQVTAMGYKTKRMALLRRARRLKVELVPVGVRLSEVTIKPKREKYSKKNNPAVALMERLRKADDKTNPRSRDFYNYDKYERITLALDNFDAGSESAGGNALVRRFPLLREHMDTSALTGDPILNVALREKSSHVTHRLRPGSEKEIIKGIRREGIDQMLDPQSTQTLYEDVLREVDIYGNDITLMQNRFVSPLSRLAADFYKFYLTDTVAVKGDTCIVLTFAPHNPRSFGFVGRLYVPKNDSIAWVKRIEMNTPRDINLNFIKNLRIVQDYTLAPDGTRLKETDDMIVRAGVLTKGSQIYARRVTVYDSHSFREEPDPRIYDKAGSVFTLNHAEERDSTWWQAARFVKISYGENSVGAMLERMRHNKLFYWTEKTLRVLVTGYVNTGNPSKFDIGPVNTFLSFNDLEGTRLKAGGMTTANLSRRFFAKGWAGWGTRDHRWKYLAELEYSFRDKSYHSREFPVHSFRLTHTYDIEMLGQYFLFTNPDNIFLSLRRAKDHMIDYHRLTKLEYTLELENNFSILAKAEHSRRMESPWIKFVDGYDRDFGHFTTSSLSLTLRYAPGEKFFQTKTGRLPVNLDAPVIQMSHTWAPKGFAGNRFALNVTELSLQKRFWFSAWGYLDAIVRGGHVWTRTPFPNLLIPNANLSYTIQPESFALMNAMEFVNDSYASWDLTYWLNGALLNYIPYVRKLKLREVVAFRGVWGHLSDRNNPDINKSLFAFPIPGATQKMTGTPYMEASVGLDNIFRILRLDYVWRLTYRNAPDCDRWGIRLALHFTF